MTKNDWIVIALVLAAALVTFGGPEFVRRCSRAYYRAYYDEKRKHINEVVDLAKGEDDAR
jgi:hypothetical protein